MAMVRSAALTLALAILAATTPAAHAGEESTAVGASPNAAVSLDTAGASIAGSSSSSERLAGTAGVAVAADAASARSFAVYPQADGTDYSQGVSAYPSRGSSGMEGTVVNDGTIAGVPGGASGEQGAGSSSVHTVLVSVVGAVIVMTALCCCISFCCCKEMCGCLFGDTLSSGDYDLANLAEAGAAGAVLDHVTKY